MKKPLDTSNYNLGRSILGKDCITLREVIWAFPGLVYTDKQIRSLVKSFPSEDVLRWCKENGYTVIPAPPTAFSILELRRIQPTFFYGGEDTWYAKCKFAHEDKTPFGWIMVKKTPVSNSTGKHWENQNGLLSMLERVPNVAEMIWFIMTYCMVNNVRLFTDTYVRTASMYSKAYRIVIKLEDGGLFVDDWHNRDGSPILGLSVARK